MEEEYDGPDACHNCWGACGYEDCDGEWMTCSACNGGGLAE